MARSFTTTGRAALGSFAPGTQMSLLCWSKAPSTGALSRYIDNGSTFLIQNAGVDIKFHRDFTTTIGQWLMTGVNHGMTLTNWNHIALTYDGSSVGNAPTFYANGVSKTVTLVTAPVGTVDLTSGNWTIGNNNGGTLPHGGSLAYVSIHDVVLTQAEVQYAMYYGYVPRGLMGFWPLYGDSPEPNLSAPTGRNGTITGTTVVAGPPIIPNLFPPVDPNWMQAAAVGLIEFDSVGSSTTSFGLTVEEVLISWDSSTTANTSFTVVPGPTAVLDPAVYVTNWNVSISWTNAAPYDSLVLRRKLGSYPSSESDGVLVYSSLVNTTGQRVTVLDSNVVHDTRYYYSLFVTDNGAGSRALDVEAMPHIIYRVKLRR